MSDSWKQWEGQSVNGEFPLRQCLAASSHSAVFLTGDGTSELDSVAVKLVPADPQKAELQLTRWKLAAELSHPHLIRLLRMGRCELDSVPLLYVVMEYAEEDLSQILPRRPLTPEEARQMLAPVLDALAYLYGKGFVHSAIKPANIMAIGDQIKLSSDRITRIGGPKDSFGNASVYDPPESAHGVISPAGEVSPASDVWSLGVTLVEALTQIAPRQEWMSQPEPELPDLPAPFSNIVRHCVRPEPPRRWTVAQIAAQIAEPGPTPEQSATMQPNPRVPTRQVKTASQRARNKTRSVVPALAVCLVVAAILAVPRLLHRGRLTLATESPAPSAESNSAASSASQPAPVQPSASAADTKVPATANPSVPGSVVQRVLPDVSQSARDTIRGTVRVGVRVSVNASGTVTDAELDSAPSSKYFAERALQAARRWQFVPPQASGRSVASEWILRFEFTMADTNVTAQPTAP